MTYINKINPKINSRMQKTMYNGIIITFLILIIYYIFFNNISLSTVTTFLFDYDLGRIVLLVVLIAVASNSLFLGILLLVLVVFLYEYQNTNMSKYNDIGGSIGGSIGSSIGGSMDYSKTNDIYDIASQPNNKNITIQDILNLENNISSKQSNNSISFGNEFNENSSSIMQINPSFEGTFNNNYAPFLQ